MGIEPGDVNTVIGELETPIFPALTQVTCTDIAVLPVGHRESGNPQTQKQSDIIEDGHNGENRSIIKPVDAETKEEHGVESVFIISGDISAE